MIEFTTNTNTPATVGRRPENRRATPRRGGGHWSLAPGQGHRDPPGPLGTNAEGRSCRLALAKTVHSLAARGSRERTRLPGRHGASELAAVEATKPRDTPPEWRNW